MKKHSKASWRIWYFFALVISTLGYAESVKFDSYYIHRQSVRSVGGDADIRRQGAWDFTTGSEAGPRYYHNGRSVSSSSNSSGRSLYGSASATNHCCASANAETPPQPPEDKELSELLKIAPLFHSCEDFLDQHFLSKTFAEDLLQSNEPISEDQKILFHRGWPMYCASIDAHNVLTLHVRIILPSDKASVWMTAGEPFNEVPTFAIFWKKPLGSYNPQVQTYHFPFLANHKSPLQKPYVYVRDLRRATKVLVIQESPATNPVGTGLITAWR